MQQYLPFTVLKLFRKLVTEGNFIDAVATVPTVYGIETTIAQYPHHFLDRIQFVATVPTVYGIETPTYTNAPFTL